MPPFPVSPPSQLWFQLSAAVLVAWFGLQIIKELRPFMGKKLPAHSNGTSGDRPVDYWKSEFRAAVSDSLEQAIVPIMQQQANILAELKTNSTRHTELLLKAEIVTQQLADGQGKIGSNIHGLRESVNLVMGRRNLP